MASALLLLLASSAAGSLQRGEPQLAGLGPPVMCDPNAKSPEFCPGNIPCPKCGKPSCPCPTGPSPPTPPTPPGPPPAPPTGPAAVQNWTTHSLAAVDAQAVCANGLPATLNAFVNPQPSTTWVINIGGVSPQAPGFCVNLQNCLVFGELNGTAPKPAPTPPPAPIGFGETLLGSNCSQNSDFCQANKADLTMCDLSLGLGDAVHSGVTTFFGGANTTSKVWFKGRPVLAASIAKLGALGLTKAKKVLLTGVAHGGTAVYLNADWLSATIRKLAPSAVVKALPVDAMHPNLYNSTLCMVPMLKPGCIKAAGTCYEGEHGRRRRVFLTGLCCSHGGGVIRRAGLA